MVRYLLKRIAISIVTIFVILFILFLLLELMPGSPFNDAKLSPEQIQVLDEKYGLDKPVYERFFSYVVNIFKGDLGVSYSLSQDTPITTLIKTRFPVTMAIGLSAMLLGTIGGLLIGFLTSFFKKKWMNAIYHIFTILGIAAPSYLIAIGLSFLIGYNFEWLPLLYDFREPVLTSIMPAVALAFPVMAVVARFARAESDEIMKSDYVLLARCQGLRRRTIIFRYVVRNSLIPVITTMGTLLVGLLTGSLVIEQMFSIPGIGQLLTNAIESNDYNVVIGLCFIYSLIYIVVMLIVDLLYCVIDPRVRLTGKQKA
ncbi:MAG: ABC transporter permease [Eubacterium sp.]|nr:ABC transporter permease [Eubacterium sp.]